MKIGAKIRRLRKLKGIGQKEIADLIGFSVAQISHIENGNREIGMDDLRKISDFFDVTYDSMFTQDVLTTGEVDQENIISEFKKFALKELSKRKAPK